MVHGLNNLDDPVAAPTGTPSGLVRSPVDVQRIAELEAALRRLARDDLYLEHGSTWHDVGKLTRGVQAFALAALSKSA
jgi:hypothetical protein